MNLPSSGCKQCNFHFQGVLPTTVDIDTGLFLLFKSSKVYASTVMDSCTFMRTLI